MKSKKPTVSDEDKALFRAHIGKVEPLNSIERVNLSKQNPSKISQGSHARKKNTAELKIKPELEIPLYDRKDPVTSEEPLYFNRGGLQEKAQRKLKRGQFPSEAELDLHGFTVAQAYSALMIFLKDCAEQNIRHIRVIHGKGYSATTNNYPILKNKVNNWLRDHPQVLAFSSATKNDGGAGVLYVWLKAKIL